MANSSAPKRQSASSFVVTLLAALGGLAIFVLILIVAYLPKKAPPAGDGVKTPAERKAILAELKGKVQEQATTYGWVDQQAGIVRLPLERAVELYIREQQAASVR